MTLALVAVVYLAGWLVAAVLLARHDSGEGGVDGSSAALGTLLAVWWPIILGAVLVYWIARKVP